MGMLFDRGGRYGTYATVRTDKTYRHRIISGLLIMGCLVISLIWFIFNSKFFDIKKIEINGLTGLDRGEVVSSTFRIMDESGKWFIKGRNIFLVNTPELANKLKTSLFLDEAAVDKSYPNILRLSIKERQRSVIVVSKDQFLTVDINGIVTGDAATGTADEVRLRLNEKSFSDMNHPPVIWCNLQELAASGYQIVETETVKMWLDTYKTLIAQNLRFRYIRLDEPDTRTLKIRLENRVDLMVDSEQALEPQLETYFKYRDSKPKTNPTEYIDVRIPGKLYLK
jgi:cell division septal protein FtsQ